MTSIHNAGIDKIELQLNPSVLNKGMLNRKGPRQVQPGEEWLTMRRSDFGFFLDIHFEWLNRFMTFEEAIAEALQLILNLGYFQYPVFPGDLRFRELWHFCVLDISEIEFFWDFPEMAIRVNEAAFTQQRRLDQYKHTWYSSDYDRKKHRKSTWAFYDRRVKLLEKNQLPHDLVQLMAYPLRLEIRLVRSRGGGYLNMNNLRGNMHEVLGRYLPYIACSFNLKMKGLLEIDAYSNPAFGLLQQIVKYAGFRYRGSELKKTVPGTKKWPSPEERSKLLQRWDLLPRKRL